MRMLSVVVVVAVVGTGIGWLVYAHTYQPWRPGSSGQWTGHGIQGITDGLRETALIVTAPQGAIGWYGMTLQMTGAHPVRVLGSERSYDPDEISLKFQADRYEMSSSPATASSGPITVRPGELLTIWILVRRPECSPDGNSSIDQISFRWEALGVHHVSRVPIAIGTDQPGSLYLCYESGALKHLYDPFKH